MKVQLWCKILLVSSLLLSGTPCLQARAAWESVRPERANELKQVMRTTDIEVRAASGVIYVTTNRQVQVRVFSILGQLVSQETIPAGTNRLALGMHGIFIVKIADLTCKVAL